MGTILISDSRIFDGEKFLQGDILISDGIVTKIADHIEAPADFRFSARGKTVLPGLVDIHTHLYGISPPGWSAFADSSCFPFGVTAVADASASFGDRTVLDSFGIKTVVFVIISTKGDRLPFDETERRLEKYGDKAVGIKVCYDTTFNPGLTSIEPLMQICEFAHAKGLSVTVHTSNTPIPMAELLSVLEPGDIATHVYHRGPNSVADDDFACIHDARKRGVILDIGFCGNLHVDFEILRNAISCGAQPDVISTDLVRPAVFTQGGKYGLTMCMSMAKHLGMAEADIFRAVTSSAANALKQPWGRLKEGGVADIAVLELCHEPFDIADKNGYRIQSDMGYRCVLTVSGGNVVYRR